MKIIQVLNHFLPHQIAGTEVYVWALSTQLQQNKVEVEVLIPRYGFSNNDSYQFDSINVFRYAEPSIVDRALIMGKRIPDGLAAFKKHIAEQQPDIIHFHELAGSNGITLHHVKAAKASGAKVLMTFHLAGYTCRTGTLVYKEKELCNGKIDLMRCSECYLQAKGFQKIAPFLLPITNAFRRLNINTSDWGNKLGTALATKSLIEELQQNFAALIEQCDQLVTLTKWYEQVLLLNGVHPSKITYIPQGLPIKPTLGLLEFDSGSSYPIRLVFLGRISPLKGLDILIEAMLDFPEDQILLDIYGHSTDKVYEQECRKKTANKSNVNWRGELSQEKVVPTLKQYHALCLCSTFSEMSPLVIQEAFTAGIPVIASDVYGNAEQITDGINGLLFQFKNVASLRAQIQRCIDDPNILLELSLNLSKPRSFEAVAIDYYNLYQTLVSAL